MKARFFQGRFLSICLFLGGVSIVGCGKAEPKSLHLDSLSESRQTQIRTLLKDFNDRAGATLITESSSSYPIVFSAVSRDEIINIEPRNASRNGHAQWNLNECRVRVLEDLFDDEETLHTVTFHEWGHCFGLGHDPKPGRLMSAQSTPFARYSPEQLSSFFERLMSSVSIN